MAQGLRVAVMAAEGQPNGNGVFRGSIDARVGTLEREMGETKGALSQVTTDFVSFSSATKVHRLYLRIAIGGIYAFLLLISQHLFLGWF